MENLTTKQKIIFVSLIIIMLTTIGYYFINSNSQEEFDVYSNVGDVEESNIIKTEQIKIVVHIVGCVENEGIVELQEGARIADAIEAAGGLTADASLNGVNLAYPLQDGQKIKIPSNIDDIQEETEILLETSQNTKVNINKATQTELEMLNRNRSINSIKNY